MPVLREEDQDDPVITQGDTVTDESAEGRTQEVVEKDTVVEEPEAEQHGDTRQVDRDNPEHAERARETAKERRDRAKKAKERDKRELDFQRKELSRVDGELREFRRQQLLAQAQNLDVRVKDAQEKAQRFDTIAAAAISKQQGADAVDAQRLADGYREQGRQAEFERQQLIRKAQTPTQPQQPAYVPLANRWMQDNSWYTDDGSEDSRIVKAIDDAIAAEGFDPHSREYWDELTRRVQKRLPQHFDDSEDDDVEPTTRTQKPRERSGPPTGGTTRATSARNPSGGTEYYISKERKQALIEAGYWDDPKMRLKMAKRYADIDRQNSNNS